MADILSLHSGNDAATPTASGLVARNLTVRFQGLAAISDVSLHVGNREIFGLIGPNGAGKTTLVNCLTGLQTPTEGAIFLHGSDTAGWRADRFRLEGIARTFQAGRLFNDLSVLENVEVTGLGLGLARNPARAASYELLEWIGIADKASIAAGALAYTDQRRLSIVRALAVAPQFILLDEPAAGMSDAEADELVHHIAEIPDRFGCGVLLIEHNMHVVMSICHRVHVLDGGKTLAVGTPDEIKRHEGVLAAYLGMEA
ncbi:ABC transporter ATP-binding protein [Rhizobium leguminosarum bv. viciae]|uniref:ABC transporter ATP-binding protein n=1 Tax=Rhizobium leguminosarum TaxID=384 RepID=UPI00103AFB0F|nr:ABC transporter ATP-binding protein [Rhizobium leguminosarum]TBY54786.1 ABC transporter ATP-binding protein [Rhizobium leguminosarum bv. viciae]